MDMDALVTEGSQNSNEAMKEDLPTKVNGEMNGSVEGMEVEEESIDGDGADVATDESVYGSSRARDGDVEDPNSRLGSEADIKSTSQFESENECKDSEGEGGKTGSHFGSEYAKSEGQDPGMDADGLDDAEGDSAVNSEDEYQLLNSDNEGGEKKAAAEDAVEGDDDDEEEEEEGDINADDEQDGKPEGEEGEDKQDKTDDGSHQDHNGTSPTTPTKKKKAVDLSLTPRRSSRTVQKPQRFGQDDGLEEDDEEYDEGEDGGDEGPSDPLADTVVDKENRRFPRMIGNTTIVVSDTKRLADIAQQRAQASQQKKEPTLVIIDTNSILSGRGGIPMQTAGGVTITQQPAPARAQPPPAPKPKPPPILPTLTDDMYVVEAPSFIVPYVYEKPPVKQFKKYLRKMLKAVRKQQEEDDKREEEEDAAAEAAEKEKEANDAKIKEGGAADVKEVEKMDVDEPAKSEKPEKMEEDETKEDDKESEDKPDDEVKKDEAVPEATKPDETTAEEVKKESEAEKKTDSKVQEESSESEGSEAESEEEEEGEKKKTAGSYFDNPLGKFFMQIGMNLVQEFVQTDLLKQQKKKQKAGKGTEETQAAINSLKKNLMLSKENNEPYTMEQTKCEFCSFRTESKLIMAHHLETPHMRNYVYRCNFCPLEVRGPHDILYHMEAEHCVRGRLERAPAFHQCPQCPFEDNQKGKLTRHLMTCGKKFRAEKNLEPPPDWEPPAKIPRLPRKPNAMPMGANNPLYNQVMAKNLSNLMPKGVAAMGAGVAQMGRGSGRGRPAYPPLTGPPHLKMGPRTPMPQLQRAGMMYRNPASSPVMMPSYPMSNPLYQQKNPATVKLLNQPSISITPLPRQTSNPQPGIPPIRPGAAGAGGGGNSKTTFVICEICDGYIKDLEQLRNHMQWIHKVKIHPKMIYNRPPLNCQKCQFRFFTDQGLERHLLGSHGLVTSSMQDHANKGKDGGRCPVCGRVYQWKLLNHVARDHNMTLKPAHLSYKCTVCTATFGMYKQFESHVYSAHSVVAKRVMDKKNGQAPSTSRSDTANLLKPLKINDEITIIPQPAKKPASQRPVPGSYRVGSNPKSRGPDSVQVIDLEDSPNKGENGSESLTAVRERLKRRQSLEIRQLESEDGDESGSDGGSDQPEPNRPQEQPMDEDDQATEGDSDE